MKEGEGITDVIVTPVGPSLANPPLSPESFRTDPPRGRWQTYTGRPFQAAAAAAVGVTGAVHAAGPSLIAASRAGNAGLVKRLLKQRGADVNDTEGQLWGNTPLKEAANYNHLQVVELLIAAGADLDMADRAGETPLMVRFRSPLRSRA